MIYVFGGSVIAVATAVRLSKKGYRVILVHQGRRLGLFPFTVTTEKFVNEMGVDVDKHSEYEIVSALVGGERIGFGSPLHVLRSTPFLEETLAYNEIPLTFKPPNREAETLVDLNPKSVDGLKLTQIAEVEKNPLESQIMLDARPKSYVAIMFRTPSLRVTHVYSEKEYAPSNKALAWTVRPPYYLLTPDSQPQPILSLAGQDVAESEENPQRQKAYVDDVLTTLREGLNDGCVERFLRVLNF